MSGSIKLFFDHSTSIQVILFALLLSSLWVIEVIFSLDAPLAKWQHSVTNFLFIFSALPIQLLLTIFVVAVANWTSVHHWGLLYLITFHHSTLLYYVSGFILMDFFEYVYHLTMHKTGFLWKFHLVHHSDLEVDVSTTVREHPGETMVRVCFLILWVFLSGASIGVLVLRQTIQTISNVCAHSRIRLNKRADRIIGLVFITPNLHHVHHHFQLPYTDSNYGDVLSIWDRLFGTYRQLSIEKTVFGIDTHFDKAICGNYAGAIKMPFKKLAQKNLAAAPDLPIPVVALGENLAK